MSDELDAIMLVLKEHSTMLVRIDGATQATNGRVNKLATLLAVLRYAVFGGGPLLIAAIAYLYTMHL